MIEWLRDNPLLILFAVAALGFALGQIRIRGFSLGTAAVLFAGLGVGAIDPQLRLPEIVYQTGLVLFVYTMGLSGGPVFFRSLRRQGLQQNGFVLAMLALAGLAVHLVARAVGLSGPTAAGLFAGSLTNTPALAGVLEVIRHAGQASDALQAEPVIAYSVAYPIGVIGMILAMIVAQRWWQTPTGGQVDSLEGQRPAGHSLLNETIEVKFDAVCGMPISQLQQQDGWRVLFSRLKRDGQVMLCQDDTRLQIGDRVSVIGLDVDLTVAVSRMGRICDEHLEMDRSRLDYRRMAVSNREVVGRPLRDLHLTQRFGALVTRIRRGDVDVLAHGDSVLELGDRVRVVAPPSQMGALAGLFGDSYKVLSEVDGITLGLGIAMGLLLGALPVPLPGGTSLRLGFAGGPLLAGLILGARGKTGPLAWSLPYSANLTLRQFGLILFLAGIGTRSGYAFASTLAQGGGLLVVGLGAVLTMAVALITLWTALRVMKLPFGTAMGMLAGLQTQPALLAYANDHASDDQPNIGYATVYPVAMVAKIILAQLILLG
jgi:putative transport protein